MHIDYCLTSFWALKMTPNHLITYIIYIVCQDYVVRSKKGQRGVRER